MSESLQIAGRLDGPARARGWMRGLCAAHDLEGLCDDAVLMVSELVTNAVLHAGTGCVLVVELDDQAMRVDVLDEDHHVIGPVQVADGSERGRGLNIVAALSTTWGVNYRDPGKSVWFTIIRDRGLDRSGAVPRWQGGSSDALAVA